MKGKGYGNKMPNDSKGNSPKKSGTNTGATGGLKKSSEMRSDVTKTPTHPNHFPNGLA